MKLSWHSCSLWDKLGWHNWFWEFLCVRHYLPLILSLYVKEGLPFTWDWSLKNSADSYSCFWVALLLSVSHFFFLYWSPSLSLRIPRFILFHLEVLSTNPSAVFLFGGFMSVIRTGYSGGTDKPGELCYNFSISSKLTQMVNFPTRIPDYDSHSPAILDLLLSSDTSICSTVSFPPLGNSDHVVLSVCIDFLINSKQDVSFHQRR